MTLGEFQLVGPIGQGAFSTVWSAQRLGTSEYLAIKIFAPERFSEVDRLAAARRFWRGAHTLGRLNGKPHIVRLQSGPHVSGPFIWFAIDYYPAGDLAASLRAGHLSLDERFSIVVSLMEALRSAHQHGIVHRDLRPENVLLKRDATGLEVALTDFDIAHYEQFVGSRSSTTSPLGVTRYLPPEIFSASQQDLSSISRRPSVDSYALSVLVFDLFVGLDRSLPRERTYENFLALVEASEHVREWPTYVRRRLARFLNQGCDLVPKHRHKDLGAMSLIWSRLRNEAPWTVPIGLTALALTSTAGLMVTDWLLARPALSFEGRVLRGLLPALLSLASSLGLIAWAHASLTKSLPAWRARIGEVLSQAFLPGLGMTALLLVINLALLHFSQLAERMHMFSFRSASDCKVLAEDGRVLKTIQTNSWIELRLDADAVELVCPEDVKPIVFGRSWLTPMLLISEVKKSAVDVPPMPDAGVPTPLLDARVPAPLLDAGIPDSPPDAGVPPNTPKKPASAKKEPLKGGNVPNAQPAEPASQEVFIETTPPGAMIRWANSEKSFGASLPEGPTPAKLALPKGGVSLQVHMAGYETIEKDIDPSHDTHLKLGLKPASATKTAQEALLEQVSHFLPRTFDSQGIQIFTFLMHPNESTLTGKALEELEVLAKVLTGFPTCQLTIEGHVNERNTDDYGMHLSDRRAATVKRALVNLGVDSKKIKIAGYGDSRKSGGRDDDRVDVIPSCVSSQQ